MKSYDLVSDDKVEALRAFCRDYKPPIMLQVEAFQGSSQGTRVIAETDVEHMSDYDDHVYLLAHGVKRPKFEKPKEAKKRWYQFFA